MHSSAAHHIREKEGKDMLDVRVMTNWRCFQCIMWPIITHANGHLDPWCSCIQWTLDL